MNEFLSLGASSPGGAALSFTVKSLRYFAPSLVAMRLQIFTNSSPVCACVSLILTAIEISGIRNKIYRFFILFVD
jgi:hypothetical protein